MAELIRQGKAPPHAVAPDPIPTKKLFGLDVDDVVWQDVGLDDDGDTLDPPLWLCDEKVRKGIRGILLRDRCDEELCQLKNELVTQREWFAEEWRIVSDCIEAVEDEGMICTYIYLMANQLTRSHSSFVSPSALQTLFA